MNLFQQWLDGPQEYEAGRLLYAQYGPNHVLMRTLSHGATPYNTSALREELHKLAKRHGGLTPAPAHPLPAPAPPRPDVVESVIAPPVPAATEALLLSLDKQWKPLYKDASYLQSQLQREPDVQKRCTNAHRVLDLMEQVQGLWDKQAYVKQHGQLPPTPAPVAPPPVLDLSDPAAVLKRRNNLRAQISKQKRNATRAQEVAAWKVEVEQLDNLLKTLPLTPCAT